MKRYPVKIQHIAKSAIWGGQRLKLEWGKSGDGENIAETWELSVRPNEMGTVLNGEAKGMTLRAYIEACGADCVSPDYRLEDRFPLLVKLIDAADRLSVQVHPDDAYAGRVENDSGKTEMWYIVDAEKDARIVYGLAPGVTQEDFARGAAEGRWDDVMCSMPVQAGECYFIPAGMLHAIGKGILIAEIQQNSDLTYRVFDYNRRQADGSLRALHTEKALDVVRPFTENEVDEIRFARGRDGDLLANSRYFRAYRKQVVGEGCLCVSRDSFVSLLCIDGKGELIFDGESYSVRRGDSYYLPAGLGECRLTGNMTLICSEL